MNMREKRLDKLEAEIGVGKHKPGKLILSQILDGVKTVCCEQVIRNPKQRKDIGIIIEGVDLSKFPKPM